MGTSPHGPSSTFTPPLCLPVFLFLHWAFLSFTIFLSIIRLCVNKQKSKQANTPPKARGGAVDKSSAAASPQRAGLTSLASRWKWDGRLCTSTEAQGGLENILGLFKANKQREKHPPALPQATRSGQLLGSSRFLRWPAVSPPT